MHYKSDFFETTLDRQGIDECSDYLKKYLKSNRLADKEIFKYSMTLEEILLDSFDSGAEGSTVTIDCGKHFFRSRIMLSIDGQAKNVYLQRNSSNSVFGDSILRNLGLAP